MCAETVPIIDKCCGKRGLKGGHLDFSHLTELKNIYITEIYMKKQYNSPIIKIASLSYF